MAPARLLRCASSSRAPRDLEASLPGRKLVVRTSTSPSVPACPGRRRDPRSIHPAVRSARGIRGLALLALALVVPHAQAAGQRSLIDDLEYRYLTSNPNFSDYRAVFSPDDRRIVFEHTRVSVPNAKTSLYMKPVDRGAPRPLLPNFGPASTRAAWSAMNDTIAFTAVDDHGEQLFLVDPDGTNLRLIESQRLGSEIEYPHWFPNGRSVAVVDYNVSGGVADGLIKRVSFDLENPSDPQVEFLTDRATFYAGQPAVSPDGKFIAIAGQPNNGQPYDQMKNAIWILDIDTQQLSQFDSQKGRAPAWSPDGNWLLFESNRDSAEEIEYSIYAKHFPPNGMPIYRLTPSIFNAQHAVFSNDGKSIIFSAELTNADPPARGIVLIRTPRQLTAVPEPSAWALGTTILLGLVLRRRGCRFQRNLIAPASTGGAGDASSSSSPPCLGA